jgi:1-pyrroline-5-carboxylate dehydrogenase
MFTPFANEPYVDFSQPEPQRRMREALALVHSQLGRRYPCIVGGDAVDTGGEIISRNPANNSQIVGSVPDPDETLALKALDAAWAAFPDWSRTDPKTRARYLVKVAAILRRRIYEFSAWMCYEVSKNWLEAYADTAEAIDFLEFYAREMVRLAEGQATTPFQGEENDVVYLPLGAGVAISPWNFPLAIMAGMTVAAAVTGNTVITKPAEQAPVIASKFYEVLQEASFPPGVVNLLHGRGEVVGATLVEHPRTRFISFTGSRDVGLLIHREAAVHRPGQKWIKRTVLEMGGKDAMLIDRGVDLDAAADAVVAAAFGFQGQKCSACSRLIAHTEIYDALLERVVSRAASLTIGDPTSENPNMGAVIDEESLAKISGYIDIGRSEGRMVLGDQDVPAGGTFVGPHIFADVAPTARIAQEEIFGPVLAVIRAESFEHGLEIVNGTEYGLTGGCFSNNREHLEMARRDFHVGNLYLNRKCTGALVDVQPFGGFNLSGTDSKAGGRDYLQLFLQQKSISERF